LLPSVMFCPYYALLKNSCEMKTVEPLPAKADPVITEVRAIKRAIIAEHGGDLESFFAEIRQRQSTNPRLVESIESVGLEEPSSVVKEG
jgi:hypothetical protein